MKEREVFLRNFRYHPAAQALIPVDACMGFPLVLCEEVWYLPFWKRTGKTRGILDSELFVGFPSGEIYRYEKIRNAAEIEWDEAALLQWKQRWTEGKAGWETWQSMPEAFWEIYRSAKERWERDDKYPAGI